MWRITDDFWDSWHLLLDMFDRCKTWQGQAKPTGYPDCDMLPVGTIGKGFNHERQTRFTKDEQKTMMSLWCMVSSPLMLGAELPKLDEWTLGLLTNKKVLALATETERAEEYYRNKKMIIWKSTQIDSGDTNLAIFNISDAALEFTLKPFIKEWKGAATELWSGDIVEENDTLSIPTHGVLLLQTASVVN